MASLLAMLMAQGDQQRDVYGFDLPGMYPEERARYIRDNALALVVEVTEALDETGWKPWGTSRHLNLDQYLEELVDVLIFWMNLGLATGLTPQQLAVELDRRFTAKLDLNKLRQLTAYTGSDAVDVP